MGKQTPTDKWEDWIKNRETIIQAKFIQMKIMWVVAEVAMLLDRCQDREEVGSMWKKINKKKSI